MRTSTVTIAGPPQLTFEVGYPNSVAFMFSPQIASLKCTSGNPGDLLVRLTVRHLSSGRQYLMEKSMYDGKIRVDISRAMQLLSPDIDTLFHRLDHNAGQSLAEDFSIAIGCYDSDGKYIEIKSVDKVTALYGALDAGEIYGEHNQRRLWVNFPQTFNLWRDEQGDMAFVLDDAYIVPDLQGEGDCHECDLIGTMFSAGELDEFKRMLPGRPQHNIGLTWRTRIERGREQPEEFRTVTLVPDYSKPCDGTYLRWLNRRGEVSYYLFKNSQIRVTSVVSDSFRRHYDNDPSEPLHGAYVNPQKAVYRESREMIIGATGLSYDEFEDICDLATSPIVERLMPAVPEEDTEVNVVFDGGQAGTSSKVVVQSDDPDRVIEAGDAEVDRLEEPEYVWQRVNIAAGTFSRNIRRITPNLQDIEIIVELPERNTIKL